MELSRYQSGDEYVSQMRAYYRGIAGYLAYVETGQLLTVRVKGLVVELHKLLCS